jgi:hypothetical protein
LNDEGVQALLDRWRRAEQDSVGFDPDSIAYLDAAEQTELARAAYGARVDETELLIEDRRTTLVGAFAELA